MSEIYGLSRQDVRLLREMARTYRSIGRGSVWPAQQRTRYALIEFLGEIVAPASGSDFTDERYNVRRQAIDPGGDPAALSDDAGDLAGTVTATNLAEISASSHKIPHGTYVWVTGRSDVGGSIRYTFIYPAETSFWAKITGSAAADSPAQNRWKYAWSEVYKSSAGYGGWSVVSGGRSGTTSSDPSYNSIEDPNDNSGVEGNGVDVNNLDTSDYTFAIQPVASGAIVRMTPVAQGSNVEYWFAYENAVDGGCD